MVTQMKDTLTILHELKQLLKERFNDGIQDVILFGSQVTGEAHQDSDYDVLVVLNCQPDWKYKKAVRYACYDIALQYDIFLDVKVISEYELQHTIQGKHPLFLQAIEQGVFA